MINIILLSIVQCGVKVYVLTCSCMSFCVHLYTTHFTHLLILVAQMQFYFYTKQPLILNICS